MKYFSLKFYTRELVFLGKSAGSEHRPVVDWHTLSGSELPVSTGVLEPCQLSRIWWEESAAEWARQQGRSRLMHVL